jgi:WD40 repeat protein
VAHPDEPWPGLESYTEDDAGLFYGRETEAEELFRLLRRDVLTVIFGPSGTGKTSLLQAGLFPRLASQHFFPVPVRFDYSHATASLAGQVRAAFSQALARYGIEQESQEPAGQPDETLWEFLHRTVFWDRRNDAMTPVIVIDQFEEIFTLGKGHPGANELLAQLADLVENYIPAGVGERLERAGQTLPPRASEQHYKVMIALREDFVSRLDLLRRKMPSVMHNRFALTRLNGRQALRPVLLPAAGLVPESVAEQIVRKVASADAAVPLEELSVDPALLSLMCRELNARRLRERLPEISADLVNDAATNILSAFYEQAFAGLDPRAREFVEDRLLTSDGFRTTVARHAAVQQGLEADMDSLVDRRVLRAEERLGLPHLELTHDVLTRVARLSRDARVERQRKAEEEQRRAAEEAARRVELARTRRTLAVVGSAAVVSLVLAILAFQSYRSATNALNVAREARIEADRQTKLAQDSAASATIALKAAEDANTLATQRADEATRQTLLAREAGELAESQRLVAVSKGEEALSRQLAAQAQTLGRLRSGLPLSALLSVESMRRYPSFDADQALRASVALLPRQLEQFTPGEDETFQARISGDGRVLALMSNTGIRLWNLEAKRQTANIETIEAATTVAISNDGTRIAASVPFGKFRLGIADASGRLLTPKPLPPADVLAWSPDNRYLAAAGAQPETTVWDTSSFTSVSLSHKGIPQGLSGGVRAVAFSPDGKRLAIARRGAVGLWDTAGWSQIGEATFDGGVVVSLAFSPDGEQLAAASNGQGQLWRVEGLAPVARFAAPPSQYFQNMTLTFDRAGRFLAVGSDSSAAIWELRGTPVERLTIRHEGRIGAIVFSPDGSYVAAGGEAAASVYHVPTGREVGRMTHPPAVVGLGFVRDGRALLTVSFDGSARVWGTEGAGRGVIVPADGGLQNATFTTRGEAILAGDRNSRGAQIVDLRTGTTVGTYDAAVAAGNELLVVQRIASGLVIRDLRSGRDVARLEAPQLVTTTVKQGRTSSTTGLQRVKFSPDGRYLCAFSTESEPQLWDVRSSRRIALPELQQTLAQDRDLLDAAFSPDGRLIAVRDTRTSVLVYSLSNARLLTRLTVGQPRADLEFSRDGSYLATIGDANLWSVAAPEQRFPRVSDGGNILGFSPDGRFLVQLGTVRALPDRISFELGSSPDQVTFNASGTVFAARDGRAVTLWDIDRKRRLATLPLRNSDAAVAFSGDGQFVATTDDTLVRVWRTDGREVARIEHLSKVTQVAFSPGGDLLSFARVTPEGESAIHLLRWRPQQLITEACQRLTRNLDPDEWREYIGAETYRKTCPNIR